MLSISAVQMYLGVRSFGWCWQLGCKLRGNSLIITSGPNATEKEKNVLWNRCFSYREKEKWGKLFLSVSECEFVTISRLTKLQPQDVM
jgi:hypothetical protein